jgi:hypothetical protein
MRRAEDKLITKELAAEYLKKNHPRNRAITRAPVEEFKRHLREGTFIYTHQGIAFDVDGCLVDGQKRLTAVVETGISARMQVTWDLQPESLMVVDTGERRHDYQRLYMGGLDIDKDAVALVKAVLGSVSGVSARVPLELIREAFEKLQDGLKFLRTNTSSRRTNSVVRAVIVRAFYTADHGRLVEFCSCVFNQQVSSNADGAAVLLVKKMASGSWASWKDRRELYCLTERALSHFLNYQTISNLRPVVEELFHLPWEPGFPHAADSRGA